MISFFPYWNLKFVNFWLYNVTLDSHKALPYIKNIILY